MCPDMRLPGKTRPGVWRWPIEPGARCETELPCDAMPPAKLWRFMVPAKPLPIVVPVTSTTWPALKTSTLISDPGASSAPSPVGETELDQRLAGLDLGLGIVTRQRLHEPRGFAVAEGDLHRAVAVGIDRFHLRDAVRQHLDHRDRDRFAAVREDTRHSGLTANQTYRHRYVLVHRPGCDWPGAEKTSLISITCSANQAGQGISRRDRLRGATATAAVAPLERYRVNRPGLGERAAHYSGAVPPCNCGVLAEPDAPRKVPYARVCQDRREARVDVEVAHHL